MATKIIFNDIISEYLKSRWSVSTVYKHFQQHFPAISVWVWQHLKPVCTHSCAINEQTKQRQKQMIWYYPKQSKRWNRSPSRS